MLDQSINFKSIEFVTTERIKSLYAPLELDSIINKTVDFYNSNAPYPLLIKDHLAGKYVYKTDDIISHLLLMRLNLTLKTVNRVKQTNRNSIVKVLSHLLADNNQYSVVRLDVKDFYESININDIVDRIREDVAYSKTTFNLLKKWVECFYASGVCGIPRGLGISATLSEYYMRPFDKKMKNLNGVFYYARFVDDIIILSSSSYDAVYDNAIKHLPPGLTFGNGKHKKILYNTPAFKKDEGNKFKFDYLGYNFNLCDKRNRKLEIDLSEKKKKKIKTRIIKSILSFINDGNFALLEKRIRFLTCNYYIKNKFRDTSVKSGIYYNYHYINVIDDKSSNLHDLDRFLRKMIWEENFSLKVLGVNFELTTQNKMKLCRLSFVYGHKNKIFHRFKPDMLKRIKKCWSY